MSDFFEQKYKNEEVEFVIRHKDIIVITFESKSSRTLDKSKLEQYSKSVCCYNLTYLYESDCFTVEKDKNKEKTYDLSSGFSLFLNTLDKNKILIIDITNVDLRFLGIMLFHLKKQSFIKVLCLYLTPNRYNKNTAYQCEEKEFGTIIHNDQFDLYNSTGKRRGINGYLVDNDKNATEKNILLLGFEGSRVRRLCEVENITMPIPVLTLPAFKPGWQNYALVANMDLLNSMTSRNSIEYVAADSVKSIYDKMREWRDTYDDFLRISPLGTKINALGIFLFILNNPKTYDILYDNPIETKSNSCGVENYLYYDITDYLYMEKI